jgi:hypothetical protein
VAGLTHVDPANCENTGGWAAALEAAAIAVIAIANRVISLRVVVMCAAPVVATAASP